MFIFNSPHFLLERGWGGTGQKLGVGYALSPHPAPLKSFDVGICVNALEIVEPEMRVHWLRFGNTCHLERFPLIAHQEKLAHGGLVAKELLRSLTGNHNLVESLQSSGRVSLPELVVEEIEE